MGGDAAGETSPSSFMLPKNINSLILNSVKNTKHFY